MARELSDGFNYSLRKASPDDLADFFLEVVWNSGRFDRRDQEVI